MNSCAHCNEFLFEDSNFCPKCGKSQHSQNTQKSAFSHGLTILCILTMVGSVFTIGRALIYELVASIGSDNYFRGWIYMATSIGTLLGAILMIMRRKIGLHVYTVCQVLYIITVCYATIVHSIREDLYWSILLSLVFLVPALFFLVIYWTKNIRSQLN